MLVDTGFAHTTAALLDALARIGGPPPALIVVTHAHPDHAGGLAELKRATGAPAAMHPLDGELVRAGSGGRPLQAGAGTDAATLEHFNSNLRVEACEIEVELADGDSLPGFPELTVVHAPGHAAGQVVLLWRRGDGTLIAADAASDRESLTLPRVAEDFELATRTLARLAALEFDSAAFGHGATLRAGASAAFQARWAQVAQGTAARPGRRSRRPDEPALSASPAITSTAPRA